MTTRKLFSTKIHGVIDYGWASALPVLPRFLSGSSGVNRLLKGAGLGTLIYSLLTRYELGAVKLLPMPAHLAFDVMQGIALVVASLWLGERRKTKAALVGLGLVALAVALNTERAMPTARRLQWPQKRRTAR